MSWAACGGYEVQYKVGKYVTANKGCHKELFVFKGLESAKQGIGALSEDQLYLAEAKGPMELSFRVVLLPPGTLCFKKVKLIRRIS